MLYGALLFFQSTWNSNALTCGMRDLQMHCNNACERGVLVEARTYKP